MVIAQVDGAPKPNRPATRISLDLGTEIYRIKGKLWRAEALIRAHLLNQRNKILEVNEWAYKALFEVDATGHSQVQESYMKVIEGTNALLEFAGGAVLAGLDLRGEPACSEVACRTGEEIFRPHLDAIDD